MTMNLGALAIAAKRAERLIANNSPVILTAAGVTGVLATAYLAAKAAFQAKETLDNYVEDKKAAIGYDENGHCKERVFISYKEIAEVTWKCYIPAGLSAAMSITAIIAANRISTKRAMAMASAYSLTERAFAEYKDRVKEKMGERKEQAIRDELVQEKVNKTPLPKKEIVIISGDVLCFDVRSGRYFQSNMEKIKRAENEFNREVIHDGYASLSILYDLLGLETTGEGDEVGWDASQLVELTPSSGIAPDGRPYLAITFTPSPKSRYDRVY